MKHVRERHTFNDMKQGLHEIHIKTVRSEKEERRGAQGMMGSSTGEASDS